MPRSQAGMGCGMWKSSSRGFCGFSPINATMRTGKSGPSVDLEEVQDYLPASGTDPTDRLTLWQAVMSLSDDLRATVTLYYYDGLSVREIGTVLGISEAAVKTRLSRGRGRLRQLLREE